MDTNPYAPPSPEPTQSSADSSFPLFHRVLAFLYLAVFTLVHGIAICAVQVAGGAGTMPAAMLEFFPILIGTAIVYYALGRRPKAFKRFWQMLPYLTCGYVGLQLRSVWLLGYPEKRVGFVMGLVIFYGPAIHMCFRVAYPARRRHQTESPD